MLPLSSTLEEVERSREMLAEESARLIASGIEAAETVPVGVMVETPAAVLIADRLAQVSAFFSIGTNDLTQYTLAVDRGNARLADRFQPHDPAMLRQIRQVVRVGQEKGLPVSVCGEMASDPLHALLLAGLGVRTLSVSPPSLPAVKWLLRAVPLAAAAAAAEAALDARHARDVMQLLRDAAARHMDVRLLEPEGDVARPLVHR
jgi:phosphoenolpyruvate-protein kinase (PTS system EI component)